MTYRSRDPRALQALREGINGSGGLSSMAEKLFGDDLEEPTAPDATSKPTPPKPTFGIPFVRAGNAIFTVDNGKSEHYTYRVRRPDTSTPLFVGLLTGPDNTRSYTYMGVLADDNRCRLTKASRFNAGSKPIAVFNWALRVLAGRTPLPDGYTVQHSGHCGMCGRLLTEPESLRTGIGPICRNKLA